VTEDHELVRDHEPAMKRANWSTRPESNRDGGGWIDESAAADETGRTPSCACRWMVVLGGDIEISWMGGEFPGGR
jgi:hypothetical protein